MKNSIVTRIFAICLLFAAFQAFAQEGTTFYRPYSQDGVNLFEPVRNDQVPFDGFKVKIGGSFNQSFQALNHSNKLITDTLVSLTPGFNLAVANLNLDVLLADGVSLNLVTYLSSRHHQESWVKGGYIQFNKVPFFPKSFNDNVMKYFTLRIGHMEINYGDAHYRRTDNGQALYNPFVDGYIMDGYTTEIGGELYFQTNGFSAMASVTNGEIKGDVVEIPASNTVDKSFKRSPAIIGKVAYDKAFNDDLRLRVSASIYTDPSSRSNTLYGGDRTGSRYYLVLENKSALADQTKAAFSGRFNPGFSDAVTAIMGNVFFKFKGLEIFGTYETASGNSSAEPIGVNDVVKRKASQFAVDGLYRFKNVFLGVRYDQVNADLAGTWDATKKDYTTVGINRIQAALGWYITKNIMLKGEYVTQKYTDYPTTNRLNEAKFDGIVIEAAVAF